MPSRNPDSCTDRNCVTTTLLSPSRKKRSRSVRDLLSPRGRGDALLVLSPEIRALQGDEAPSSNLPTSVIRFVVFLIILHLFASMLLFSVKTYATTIERRYGLTASMVGTIVAAADFGYLVALVPSAFAASRFARPRIIAAGGLLMSFGGFLCCAPHFFCGVYEPVPVTEGSSVVVHVPQLCAKQSDDFVIVDNESSASVAGHEAINGNALHQYLNPISCTKRGLEAFFVFATFLIGFGAGPVLTLHFSYVDDFAPKSKSPLVLATIQTFSVFGIIFSYSAAGALGRIYVDVGRIALENVFLKSGDVRWVGAWWLGFLVASTGALLWSLPLLCFGDADDYVQEANEDEDEVLDPESAAGMQVSKTSRSHHRPAGYPYHSDASSHHLAHSVFHRSSQLRPTRYHEDTIVDEDIIHPLQHVATNWALVVSLLSTVGWHFQPVMNGTFVLKYLQQEFDFSVAASSVTVGCIIWIPACIGIVLGGYLHSHYQWDAKQVTVYLVALMLVGCVCYPAGCPTRHVVGLSRSTNRTRACAESCKCGDVIANLDPVCGADGRTYATPCLAGCANLVKVEQETVYDACRCVGLIDDGRFVFNHNRSNALAADGSCSNKCDRLQLLIFLVNFVTRVLVLSMTYIPYGVFLMRSVRATDKAVAVAVKDVVGKLLGDIPGSILTGKLFDSCCMVWSTEKAGGCQLYDLDALRIRFWLINFIPSLCAVVALLLSIGLLRPSIKVSLPKILVHPPEGMSKRKAEEGDRESEEEEEGDYEKKRRVEESASLQPKYPYEEPGPSHRSYPQPLEQSLPYGELPSLQQPPPLHTRGPGRPRIHPPKPAGVSRPRGRPKGSKNKKPRKRKEVVRIERPPKRPRGRPRKWPPEMWEGFQRTREAAVQQQLKQQQQLQQQQQQQHQQMAQHEMPGPSHVYMEPPGEPSMGMQLQRGGLLPPHMQHPHQHPSTQQLPQPQPQMPHYMQMPPETEQPQEYALVMPRPPLPQEMAQQQQHQAIHLMPHMLLHGAEEQQQPGEPGTQEQLLWMQQMPPEDQPPHTTS